MSDHPGINWKRSCPTAVKKRFDESCKTNSFSLPLIRSDGNRASLDCMDFHLSIQDPITINNRLSSRRFDMDYPLFLRTDYCIHHDRRTQSYLLSVPSDNLLSDNIHLLSYVATHLVRRYKLYPIHFLIEWQRSISRKMTILHYADCDEDLSIFSASISLCHILLIRRSSHQRQIYLRQETNLV